MVRPALKVVLRAGLEPARPFRKLRILSPVRLPISPPEHIMVSPYFGEPMLEISVETRLQ